MKVNHKVRRTLKDLTLEYREDFQLTPEEIYRLIMNKTWPYKTDIQFYHKRDRALMALYFLTGGRNNELLGEKHGLRKKNFDFSDPHYIIIKGMYISKRSEKTIAKSGPKATIRDPILLPRFGELSLFTNLVEDYLQLLAKNDVLFRFGTRRSHQIIKFVTGKWVHWFRAMSENFYGKLFRDPKQLAKFLKVNLASIMDYIPFEETQYRRDLERTK